MADAQINNPQAVGAPSDYALPPSVAFVLKAVRAKFDGSGAAGAFLPCVSITSDAGLPVADACDQAVEVAAGGSAQVSFFPGVKHAGGLAAASADAYPMHEDMPVLSFDYNGVYFSGWNSHPTADAACVNAGYTASAGAIGAYIAFRTMLGPQGSIHAFNFLHLTGPDYGQIWGYLASIPEDDPASGAADPTNVLTDISTLTFVLAFKLDTWSAALTRNVQHAVGATGPGKNPFVSTPFRVLGAPGDPFTAPGFDNALNLTTINGGPGAYALKLVIADKVGASTGYKVGISELNRQRNDWAFA